MIDVFDEVTVDPFWPGVEGRRFAVWKVEDGIVYATDTDETARPRNRAFPIVVVKVERADPKADPLTTTEGASDGRSVT